MEPKTSKPAKKQAKRPPLTDAERHQRFLEMAGEVGADESPAAFDRAFADVVTPLKKD